MLASRLRCHGPSEWIDTQQRVPLTWTRCPFGGQRPWFRCCCGRRVAILYDNGDLFACRQCCRLAYPCQSESPVDRSLRRAQTIRERLGGNTNVFSYFPEKPKGMHWGTYDRLRARGKAADRQTIDLIAQYLKRRPIQAKKRP